MEYRENNSDNQNIELKEFFSYGQLASTKRRQVIKTVFNSVNETRQTTVSMRLDTYERLAKYCEDNGYKKKDVASIAIQLYIDYVAELAELEDRAIDEFVQKRRKELLGTM